jgi:hypothetical protein
MADIHLGVITIYPELANNTLIFTNGTITIRDDSDGKGPYIDTWKYDKPQPSLEDVIAASTSNAAIAYLAQQEQLAQQIIQQAQAQQKKRPIAAQPNTVSGTQTL